MNYDSNHFMKSFIIRKSKNYFDYTNGFLHNETLFAYQIKTDE